MDRPQVGWRGDAGLDLTVGEAADHQGHDGEQGRTHGLETRLDEHLVQRLLEQCPARFVIAHPDQDPDEHCRHVLQHDALRHHCAAGQHGDDEDDDEIGEHEQQDRLPERVLEVGSHLCPARNCTNASSCSAVN